MSSVFASDLHLTDERPESVELFERFLKSVGDDNATLYLLGDVFEIWLGDDDDTGANDAIVRMMRQFTQAGGELYVMSGNRDFLFGKRFEQQTGATLLGDWHKIDLFGVDTLLTHGDLLCTKDVKYQAFRQFVRNPQNQKEFLAHPLSKRREIAAQTRTGTQASMLEKDEFIMDVDQPTVESVMREHQVNRLIHGHTHRPASHEFELAGTMCERVVLGDWYSDGSIIECSTRGLTRYRAHDYVTRR